MPEEVVATPAATAETAPVETAPVTSTDPFDNAEIQQFDRTYVEGLRKEAADRRVALKPYEEAFEGYNDEEREIWRNLATTLREDPEAAATAMEAIVNGIRGVNVSEIEPTTEKPAGPAETTFLTQEDLTKALKEKDEAAALDREISSLNAEVKALGYEQNTPEYNDLMWRAANQHSFDVNAAHAARISQFEDAMTKYLADKAQEAENSPAVISTTGQPASGEKTIKSWGDARAATEARLRAIETANTQG